MSLEKVLRTLEGFGLSSVESEVYIYLAKAGPSKINHMANSLKITREQLLSALRSLKKKGIVTARSKRAALFSAIAFEELVKRYIRLNIEQAEALQETRQELLDSWQNMAKQSNN